MLSVTHHIEEVADSLTTTSSNILHTGTSIRLRGLFLTFLQIKIFTNVYKIQFLHNTKFMKLWLIEMLNMGRWKKIIWSCETVHQSEEAHKWAFLGNACKLTLPPVSWRITFQLPLVSSKTGSSKMVSSGGVHNLVVVSSGTETGSVSSEVRWSYWGS